MEKLVTVIIPVYNVEEYVSDCIESVLNQSYSKLEILLVNDGSTDQSGEICKRFVKKDSRVRLIEKLNGGLSSARNVGIKSSKGDFLAFVDSDDYIDRYLIERLVTILEKNNADIASCNFDYCGKNSEIIKKHEVAMKGTLVYSSKRAKELLLSEKYFMCYAWNKLYKSELFQNVTFPEGKIYEDIITTYSLINMSKTVVFTEECLYHYRIRNESITKKGFSRQEYDLLDAIRHIMNENFENANVLEGCALYYLYFIDDMILGKCWDDSVHKEFQECVHKLKGHQREKIICNATRRMQIFLCYRSINLYKRVYLLMNKLK